VSYLLGVTQNKGGSMALSNRSILDRSTDIIKELARSGSNADLSIELEKIYNKIKELSVRDEDQ